METGVVSSPINLSFTIKLNSTKFFGLEGADALNYNCLWFGGL